MDIFEIYMEKAVDNVHSENLITQGSQEIRKLKAERKLHDTLYNTLCRMEQNLR